MMKKAIGILMILFITITIFSCDKDKEKVETNDLINSQIKGNVKYYEEIEYTVLVELGEIKNDFEVKKKYGKRFRKLF